jgi:3-hydroxyisobutyrate dehydrogenase-like beta-hydroxyacid dehydrogenase
LKTIGIVSPGDMGHVVGKVLREHGLRVATALAERSQRTRSLAAQAGIDDLENYETLVAESDMILSILVPAEAASVAASMAKAMCSTASQPLFADCNAIAPQTVQKIAQMIESAGGRFVDASIIGPPPRQVGSTRFFASGPHAEEFAQLNDYGLHVIPMSSRVGDASALKMCYAALTKGVTALSIELLVAAKALGVDEALEAEFRQSQSPMLAQMERNLPGTPPKARRWVGEMEEIAATFEALGLTPQILSGAAEIYRFVGGSPLADRTPEDPHQPLLTEMITGLAIYLKEKNQ